MNSTVGFPALGAGRATIALGSAIYDIPGLTFRGPLDDFWQQAGGPDQDLYRCFRNTIVHAAQINGGLYSRSGIELTVQNAAAVLTAERSPLEELL